MFMATSAWASTKCYLTWNTKATPQGRLLFQLQVSMPHTKETECGLSDGPEMWPTPIASTGGPYKNHANDNKKVPSSGNPLATAVAMWPTPAARDHKGGYVGGRIRNGKVSMDTLDVAVQYTDNQHKTGGQLNPQWVEWLMGYPEGWTDLKD